MNTPLLPDSATTAVGTILGINQRIASNLQNAITRIENALTKTRGADNTTLLTQDQILAAANGRLGTELAFLQSLKAAVNVVMPGTYPA